MKRVLFGCAAAAGAMVATAALADGGGYLDFEDPNVPDIIDAPNPYHGTTWGTSGGDGLSQLGLMDVNWYNANYGASLTAISGDQVGWSRFGEDNISVSFSSNVIIKDFYLTPWLNFGPSSMTIDFYDDGGLVASVGSGALVGNAWTHVVANVEADQMVFRSGGGVWWLIDDLSFNKVPAPGAIALLGLAGLVSRRRRSA
jgi:hypothetical protein